MIHSIFKICSLGLLLSCLILISGCTHYSQRSAAYSAFGPNTILMRPTFSAPRKNSRNYKLNNFVFLPGFLIKPVGILADVDHKRRKSAVWSSIKNNKCAPSPQFYTLDNVEETKLPEVKVHYDFEFSFSSFLKSLIRLDFRRILGLISKEERKIAAIQDFNIKKNDIGKLKEVSIHLKNIRKIEIKSDKINKALKLILKECRYLSNQWQVIKAYSADIDVDIKEASGASVNIKILKAKILRKLSLRLNGKNQFFAIEAEKLQK